MAKKKDTPIHLIFEPAGCVAIRTACGLNCDPDRPAPFRTKSLTYEKKLVTCLKCIRCGIDGDLWAIEGYNYRKTI